MQHDLLSMPCHADPSGQARRNDLCAYQIAQRPKRGIHRTPNTPIFAARATGTPGKCGSHGDATLMANKTTGSEVGTPAERLDRCALHTTERTLCEIAPTALLRATQQTVFCVAATFNPNGREIMV